MRGSYNRRCAPTGSKRRPTAAGAPSTSSGHACRPSPSRPGPATTTRSPTPATSASSSPCGRGVSIFPGWQCVKPSRSCTTRARSAAPSAGSPRWAQCWRAFALPPARPTAAWPWGSPLWFVLTLFSRLVGRLAGFAARVRDHVMRLVRAHHVCGVGFRAPRASRSCSSSWRRGCSFEGRGVR